MDRQIIKYITPFLSNLLCGFRKGFNTQHALIWMLEKWKVNLDNGENVWTFQKHSTELGMTSY